MVYSTYISRDLCCLGALRGKRIDQVHEEQTVRVLDKEHGPRVAARPIPLFAGEHDLLVPPASHARRSGGYRIPGRSRIWRRSQVQGMGVRSQVLRDRRPGPWLYDQPNGVGRKFILSSFLVSQIVRRRVFVFFYVPAPDHYYRRAAFLKLCVPRSTFSGSREVYVLNCINCKVL